MSGPVVLILRIILAAVLYAFLGLALYTLWQEIKQHGSLLIARKIPGPPQLGEPGHPDGDVLLLQHVSGGQMPAAGRRLLPMDVEKV